MDDDSLPSQSMRAPRERITRFFLWVCVIAWGMLLGAKLFDLRVLVGAWSASPPESLRLLPYGQDYPVDTGDFFIPSSAALLLASLGAVISGWKTRTSYRGLLLLSALMIFAVLILTVVVFWPLNAALWAVARGASDATTDNAKIVSMVQRWVTCDWLRIAMASVGYAAAIRALSIPFPPQVAVVRTSTSMKLLYGVGIGVVIVFTIYFLLGVL